jgi:hypothetical protein
MTKRPCGTCPTPYATGCPIARQTRRPFQEVLSYFAMERFISRMSASPYADRFVLKGALMFLA